jgi:ABC-type branched-subunit amino acid transport system ATPase component
VIAAPLLRSNGLSRRFGGLVALEDLDLEVRRGEILGLIGPNG